MSRSSHRYTNHGSNPMGGPSFEVVQLGRVAGTDLFPRAIDLGGGTGRNALHLASNGFETTLVEVDPDLCADARALAASRTIDLNVVQGDVVSFAPHGQYNLVVASGILHFLEREDAVRLIARCRDCTTATGAHIITISPPFTERMQSNPLVTQGYLGSIDKTTLTFAYAGWTLLAYERYTKTDDHLDGKFDEHLIEKFIYAPAQDAFISRSTTRVRLRTEGRLDNRTMELRGHLRERTQKTRLEKSYGPPDHDLSETGRSTDLGLMGDPSRPFELCIAFWGRTKCYFEGGSMVGFALYESDTFHAFDASTHHE